MPFDSADFKDPGDDPSRELKAWASIRVSCAECMVADGAAHHLRDAAFLVALIDHAIWEHEMIWNEPPDLGLLGERLDLLRSMLEQR